MAALGLYVDSRARESALARAPAARQGRQHSRPSVPRTKPQLPPEANLAQLAPPPCRGGLPGTVAAGKSGSARGVPRRSPGGTPGVLLGGRRRRGRAARGGAGRGGAGRVPRAASGGDGRFRRAPGAAARSGGPSGCAPAAVDAAAAAMQLTVKALQGRECSLQVASRGAPPACRLAHYPPALGAGTGRVGRGMGSGGGRGDDLSGGPGNSTSASHPRPGHRCRRTSRCPR